MRIEINSMGSRVDQIERKREKLKRDKEREDCNRASLLSYLSDSCRLVLPVDICEVKMCCSLLWLLLLL